MKNFRKRKSLFAALFCIVTGFCMTLSALTSINNTPLHAEVNEITLWEDTPIDMISIAHASLPENNPELFFIELTGSYDDTIYINDCEGNEIKTVSASSRITVTFTVSEWEALYGTDDLLWIICEEGNALISKVSYVPQGQLTISDIMPADFPTLQADGWCTTSGSCYLIASSSELIFSDGSYSDNIAKSGTLTRSSDNFIYTNDTKTITFAMTDGELASVTYFDSAKDDLNGDYFLTKITIGDYEMSGRGVIAKYNGTATNLVIPEQIGGFDVIEISTEAFAQNNSLENVTLPSTLTSIGECAFWNCGNLLTINIPSNVTTLGDYAFADCLSLSSVTFDGTSSLESISYQCFCGCENLLSIVIPKSIKTIGDCAFGTCLSLESLTFESDSKLETIGEQSFSDNQALLSITFPESLTTIGNFAFEGCSLLNSIEFGENPAITTFGPGCFAQCGFTSVTIPDSLITIGNYAFRQCTKLQTVNFSKNSKVSSINEGAFLVTAIEDFIFPASVETVGSSVFAGVQALSDVTFLGEPNSIGDDVFSEEELSLRTITLNLPSNWSTGDLPEAGVEWHGGKFATINYFPSIIGEVLQTTNEFPTRASEGWTNGTASMYNDSTAISLCVNDVEKASVTLIKRVIKDNDDFYYIDDGKYEVRFAMTEGVLTSIAFTDLSSENLYTELEGTYLPKEDFEEKEITGAKFFLNIFYIYGFTLSVEDDQSILDWVFALENLGNGKVIFDFTINDIIDGIGDLIDDVKDLIVDVQEFAEKLSYEIDDLFVSFLDDASPYASVAAFALGGVYFGGLLMSTVASFIF